MEYTIKINNAKFFAYHGVLDYEKTYGNGFEVDVKMKCDLSELNDSDRLNKTVNYLEVYNLIKDLVCNDKYNLIETLNNRICKEILEKFSAVKKVVVKIRKPNAPLGLIDSIEIVKEMKRKNG